MRIYFDLETFSTIDIKAGHHKYSEDVEVMLFVWAIDDQPVRVWDLTETLIVPDELKAAMQHPGAAWVAHNAQFDRAQLMAQFPMVNWDIAKFECTMVRALMHSLPGGLDDLCTVLQLPTDMAKIKDGRRLVQLFCKPRPKNMKLRRATRETHPEDWARFVEYAVNDVVAMREIDKRIPRWNSTPEEWNLWRLDQRINDRGVRIDLDLCRAALAAIGEEREHLSGRVQDQTDGEVQAATQRDAMLRHLLARYGVDAPDLRKASVEKLLASDIPAEVRDLLSIRLQAASASTAKFVRIIDGTSTDGRLRGLLQFCGASRTGRWGGRGPQFQNLPRPTLEGDDVDQGIRALKSGIAGVLYANVMEIASNALRGTIVAPEGKQLIISDLAAIEGRVLAWLAGEKWKVDAFRAGADLYRVTYGRTFHIREDDVNGAQRQIGKVMELALGYAGGAGAFRTFADAFGIDLTDLAERTLPTLPMDVLDQATGTWEWATKQDRTQGMSQTEFVACDALKRLWRAAHPCTVAFWAALEDAFRLAIQTGARTRVRYLTVDQRGSWVRIKLPSGRFMCYPAARIKDDELRFHGIHQYTKQWTEIPTYGGKLAENVTQAVARDVLAHGLMEVESAGYEVVLSIHDELIAEVPASALYTPEDFSLRMAMTPHWAPGLPLAAKGFATDRYRKD